LCREYMPDDHGYNPKDAPKDKAPWTHDHHGSIRLRVRSHINVITSTATRHCDHEVPIRASRKILRKPQRCQNIDSSRQWVPLRLLSGRPQTRQSARYPRRSGSPPVANDEARRLPVGDRNRSCTMEVRVVEHLPRQVEGIACRAASTIWPHRG